MSAHHYNGDGTPAMLPTGGGRLVDAPRRMCPTCLEQARQRSVPYEEMYWQNHPPKVPSSGRLTVGLWICGTIGFMLLVVGSLKNYGPFYTAGGIWLGFVFGVAMSRRHVRRVLENKIRTGGRS